MYKVVIPSAGIGSRIGPLTKFVNKSLVTIGDKPVIAHIIASIPEHIHIVIPVGYKSEFTIQVVRALYPDRHLEFVEIKNYAGDGSGLGHTLNCAKHLLQCPFIFIPNDTICNVDFDSLAPDNFGNWLFFYNKVPNDGILKEQYRTIQQYAGKMTDILPKGAKSDMIYTGVCGVRDFVKFWEMLEDQEATDVGESYSLKGLDDVRAIETNDWIDVGNLKSLSVAKQRFKNHDYNILEKENEAIWFSDNRVIKFHIDAKFISDRIERKKFICAELTPEILHNDKNLYVYQKAKGNVFSLAITDKLTRELLNSMQNYLWSIRSVQKSKKDTDALDKFYRIKTEERLKYYFKRFETNDQAITINGVKCPPILERIRTIDWDSIYESACIANFHGDFHSENILLNESNKFVLLDWRQNFGDLGLEYGDVNYDLAKFYHGLLVSHKQVELENYTVQKLSSSDVRIDILIPLVNKSSIKVLKIFCQNNNYDFNSVKMLTALIYLNICSLHEHPYSEFLFYLGRNMLEKIISENEHRK